MNAQPANPNQPPVTRALSVCQPHAWAIAAGWKRVENRTWQTSFRGWLAIHASSSDREFTPENAALYEDLGHPGIIADLDGDDTIFDAAHFGGIIGAAEIIGCQPIDAIPQADISVSPTAADGTSDDRPPLHVFATGPQCLIFGRAIYFGRDPIACKGRLNIFELPSDVATEVTRRVRLAVACKGKHPMRPAPAVVRTLASR